MNKTELAHAIAKKLEIAPKDAIKMITAFQQVLKECFKNNEKIVLLGTGTFKVSMKKERNGVNPSNSKPMRIAARKQLTFTAARHLKQIMEINGK